MHKVGLIGYGKWGKILHKKLINICDVKFICTSRTRTAILSNRVIMNLSFQEVAEP